VGQGLALPALIRALGLAHAGRREQLADRAAEFAARQQAVEGSLRRLDELAAERQLAPDVVRPLRARHCDRLKQIEQRNAAEAGHRKLIELDDEIELLLIAGERQFINDLYRKGELKDEARRRIERDLDLREADLANLRAEE